VLLVLLHNLVKACSFAAFASAIAAAVVCGTTAFDR
jgi:hypothetical protein